MVSTKPRGRKMPSRPLSAEGEEVDTGRHSHDAAASDEQDDDFLGSTVKTVFGQCASFVDVAAFVIQSCRGDGSDNPSRQGGVLGPLFDTKRPSRKPRRNQGGTLEFPAEGMFKDDVSDLSANTLEEMERFAKRMALYRNTAQPTTNDGTTKPYPGQQLLPPPSKYQRSGGHAAWGSSIERGSNSRDVPLGVVASDSSSTQEDVPHQSRDWQRKDGVQRFRARVES